MMIPTQTCADAKAVDESVSLTEGVTGPWGLVACPGGAVAMITLSFA